MKLLSITSIFLLNIFNLKIIKNFVFRFKIWKLNNNDYYKHNIHQMYVHYF